MQLEHCGRFSSHLILRCLQRSGVNIELQQVLLSSLIRHRKEDKRIDGAPYLQLLQPVLTFGLLVLARLCFCEESVDVVS